MSVRPFLDTNMVAYALTDDAEKKTIAETLLLERPLISVQVCNELVNVCVRKLKYPRETAIAAVRMVMRLCEVLPMDIRDVEQAFQFSQRFGYSHWDALILAVAVRQGCDTVFSEDMQHGQAISDGLRIINPFAK